MSTHFEAVLGGARWRLTLHEDGRWEASRRLPAKWEDPMFAGSGGLESIRQAEREVYTFSIFAGIDPVMSSVLKSLADIAERAQSNEARP